MTSVIAARMVPIANEAGMLLMSPTVVTDDLSHQDDYFFSHKFLRPGICNQVAIYQRHLRRVAAAYDLSNQSYTISWLHEFRDTLTKMAARSFKGARFQIGGRHPFLPIARDLLATQPDEVLIVANAVDTALLCQQIRKLNAHVPIVTAEWGATEQLIELGGKAVEGDHDAIFDRDSIVPRYRAFRQRYRDRFDQEPGFAGNGGFDAANVVMGCTRPAPVRAEPQEVVQAVRRFEGVQHLCISDEYGDTKRETFISVVRGGRFVRVEGKFVRRQSLQWWLTLRFGVGGRVALDRGRHVGVAVVGAPHPHRLRNAPPGAGPRRGRSDRDLPVRRPAPA